MTQQEQGLKTYPHTYMVQDRSNGEEMARLRLQDAMLTHAMGGVLPEQSDPTSFRHVIDVGCGTGGWLIEAATAYPMIKELAGIDVSKVMVENARAQAEAAGVADRVTFRVMDALRMIEFPRHSFDLVNHRLNFSYLRTWEWPGLLQEYQRIARTGGVIRVTEPSFFVETNSPALNTLYQLGLDAFWNAGHLFTRGSTGVIDALAGMFHQQGILDEQTRCISMDYTANPELRSSFFEDTRLIFRTIRPFLQKWTKFPQDYDQLYKQALDEIQQPDFHAESQLLTVWGTNTQINDKIPMVEHRG